MVQIVGNLEWELLKNVKIRKSIYARITNTRFVDPLFKNFVYIKKNHTCSLLKTAPYTRKYHFSETAQNTGHTKKRPGQPGTARVLEITLVVLEYCLNQIFVEIIICNCFK